MKVRGCVVFTGLQTILKMPETDTSSKILLQLNIDGEVSKSLCVYQCSSGQFSYNI